MQTMAPAESRDESNFLISRNSLFLVVLLLGAFGVRLIFVRIAGNNATDAWSRYRYAVHWLQHPRALPVATSTDAWLPLHFWLLGAVLWLANSEVSARIFTALLGALTIGFYWSIVARAFDRQIALASSLMLALFGFHIAFSVSTASEVPTIFFLASGIYGWLRFALGEKWAWAVFSAAMFGAASLCRFEPWLCAPVLGLMLLDSEKDSSLLSSTRRMWRAVAFAVLGSATAFGWLVFSFYKWGDPLELPHRTMWLNMHFRPTILRHSLGFSLLTVPVSLLISISPLVAGLAALGIYHTITLRIRPARAIAVLTLTLFAFNYWNAIRYEATQSRYTLLYSWLLIPFALVGLRYFVTRWRLQSPRAYVVTVVFFVLWQIGILLGATYASPMVADRLAQMSPTLPLHHEMRELTGWLLKNRVSGAMILDDLNWDSRTVARLTHLNTPNIFQVTAQHYADHSLLSRELNSFVQVYHPELLVCSPYGPIGTLWSVDGRKRFEIENLGIELQQQWSSEHWRAYAITYKVHPSESHYKGAHLSE